jgi:hypothetical protein
MHEQQSLFQPTGIFITLEHNYVNNVHGPYCTTVVVESSSSFTILSRGLASHQHAMPPSIKYTRNIFRTSPINLTQAYFAQILRSQVETY